jgi:hypothetical protein
MGQTDRSARQTVPAVGGFATRWILRRNWSQILSHPRGVNAQYIAWVHGLDHRFFPAEHGIQPNILDAAVNTLFRLLGGDDPQDIVSMLAVHDRVLPLAGLAWAAIAKTPDFSPESLLRRLARGVPRFARLPYDSIATTTPVDAGDISRRLRAAIREAEAFALAMRWAEPGVFFIRDGAVGIPDPADDRGWTLHAGTRGGHWPSSSEILSAMLPRLV